MKGKNTVKRVATVVLLLAFSLWYLGAGNSEQEIIEFRLRQCLELVSFKKNEHPFEKLARGRQLGEYLSDSVRVQLQHGKLDWDTTFSRDDLVKQVSASRTTVPFLHARLRAIEVTVSGRKATVNLRVRVHTRGAHDTEPVRELVLLKVEMVKSDGSWLIRSVVHQNPEDVPQIG